MQLFKTITNTIRIQHWQHRIIATTVLPASFAKCSTAWNIYCVASASGHVQKVHDGATIPELLIGALTGEHQSGALIGEHQEPPVHHLELMEEKQEIHINK